LLHLCELKFRISGLNRLRSIELGAPPYGLPTSLYELRRDKSTPKVAAAGKV